MFCPKCGTELKENVDFCPKCGMNIKEIISQQNNNVNSNVTQTMSEILS